MHNCLHGAGFYWESKRSSVMKVPVFYGTRRSSTVFRSARHLSVSWTRSILSMLPHSSSLRSILILFPRLRLGLHGPGSSVGTATELRAGRSGIESRWRRDFPPVQTGPGAHPVSCTMGTESFLGVKFGRSVLLTTYPLLAPRSWKSRAIPLPTLWATPGCNGNTLPLPLFHEWKTSDQ